MRVGVYTETMVVSHFYWVTSMSEERHDLEFISANQNGYVIIRYNDLFIGIAQSELKLDPFLEYLGDCFLSPRVLVARDLAILDQRMQDARAIREGSKEQSK